MIQQAGLNWTASRLLSAMGLMTIPGAGLGLMVGGPSGCVLGAIWCSRSCRTCSCGSKRTKRLDALEEQFPEALDFLARSMRAGHAFSISLEMVGEELPDPLGQEFRTLFNEQNLGAPLDVALRNFTDRVPLLDCRFFTSSVLLQKQTGGNLSEILSRLAYVIRERFRLKGQVKAASAHGRMTATILTLLPVATMLALLFVAPGYLQGMAADPDGKMMIGWGGGRAGARQFLHQEDHQDQGLRWTIPLVFAIFAFLTLMVAMTGVGYRLYYKPGRMLRQLGTPVITERRRRAGWRSSRRSRTVSRSSRC